MIALVDSGLIGVSGAREGLIVVFEDRDGLPVTSSTLRCIELVKPCAEDDFVVVAQGRPIESKRSVREIVAQDDEGGVIEV